MATGFSHFCVQGSTFDKHGMMWLNATPTPIPIISSNDLSPQQEGTIATLSIFYKYEI